MISDYDVVHTLNFAGDCGRELVIIVNENIIPTAVNYKAGETFYFGGKYTN